MHSKYTRMIRLLEQKNKKVGAVPVSETWSLYILCCKDGSFYTGIAKDVLRRLAEHNAGKGARYTRPRRPLKLIYEEFCGSRNRALVREYEVKSLPKKKKEELIRLGSRV